MLTVPALQTSPASVSMQQLRKSQRPAKDALEPHRLHRMPWAIIVVWSIRAVVVSHSSLRGHGKVWFSVCARGTDTAKMRRGSTAAAEEESRKIRQRNDTQARREIAVYAAQLSEWQLTRGVRAKIMHSAKHTAHKRVAAAESKLIVQLMKQRSKSTRTFKCFRKHERMSPTPRRHTSRSFSCSSSIQID